MRTLKVLAVAATLTALALTACRPAFEQGPSGTVTGKSSEYRSSTKTRWYFLTTSSRFRVDFATYKACDKGEAYPRCAS